MTTTPAQRAAIGRAVAGLQHLRHAAATAGADRRQIEARAIAYVRDVLDAHGAEAVTDEWAKLTAPESVQM